MWDCGATGWGTKEKCISTIQLISKILLPQQSRNLMESARLERLTEELFFRKISVEKVSIIEIEIYN